MRHERASASTAASSISSVYLNEFAFRYNNRIKLGVDDDMRALAALRGIEGKRLIYRRISAA